MVEFQNIFSITVAEKDIPVITDSTFVIVQ
jgi:hypothetical protein